MTSPPTPPGMTAPAEAPAPGPSLAAARTFTRRQVLETIRRYWGFDTLRPLQEDAIRAALRGRDSLVVMPTGGGKSLCYQVPPLLIGGLTVVVSPLIALMKDQVDGLRLSGYPGAALHSGMSTTEVREVDAQLESGELCLLLVAPERLLSSSFLMRLARLPHIAAFAIDEAHCISQWGHDFRPEYRRLAELRQRFPNASMHAFTATATQRVRDDIVRQLQLRQPDILVGRFDRPNLTYRILPRLSLVQQVSDAIKRHSGVPRHSVPSSAPGHPVPRHSVPNPPRDYSAQSADVPRNADVLNEGATIVYCISRRDTEDLAAALTLRGIEAKAYHAGMDSEPRRRVQDDFAQERLNVVVATVAFGMGIDRSNVRCVVHAAMPKSIEHYQQETGRAGRDGLPAECLLLYAQGDMVRWEKLMEFAIKDAAQKSEAELREAMNNQRIQRELLDRMQRFCTAASCRHKALSEYFGQGYEPPPGEALDDKGLCGACDVCLGDMDIVADSTTIARKILSCIARTGQTFGAAHIVDVLRGADTERIRQRRHNQLSTWGLMRGTPKPALLSYIGQLLDAGIIERSPGEYPVLALGETAVPIMRGEREVTLLEPRRTLAASKSFDGSGQRMQEAEPLSEAEMALFERLREVRMDVARKRGVPPYIIFTDATLRDLARYRPTTKTAVGRIRGIGQQRLSEFGETFRAAIAAKARELELETDIDPRRTAGKPAEARGAASGARATYFDLFDQGIGIAAAAEKLGRSPGTAGDYLAEYILERRPASIAAFVDDETYALIAETATTLSAGRLAPVYEALDKKIPFHTIKAVMAHLRICDQAKKKR